LALAPEAAAQGVVDPKYRAMYDQAFRATYDHPDDLTAALEFAKVARLAGDIEGAIGALERVLIFNPDLAVVDLELGLLYRTLGSLDTARIHLLHADPAQLSPADRDVRERTLAEIDAALTRNKLSGIAATGLRYQTNVNAGATEAARLAGGAPGALASLRARGDADAFAAVTLTDSYDLDDQAGDTWDTRLSLYGTRQFHRHLLNIGLAELDTGPRFRLGDSTDPTLRPYALANVFELGGTTYFVSYGGGLNLHVPLGPRWIVDATFETRSLSFNQSSLEPTAPDYDARQVLLRLLVGYAPDDANLITATLQGADYDARRNFQTYDELRLSASYTHRFAAPWSFLSQPWAASLYGGPVGRWYDHADPNIDPLQRRADGEWDLGAALIIGLADKLDFRLEVQQVWANSNVPLYEFRDTAVLGSIELRF
jgi:tetratricopeptide (TPR) repeat protein